MWRENLLLLIKESGLTKTQIAEKGNLPYDTVKRVISGATNNPYIETLDRFAIALGCTLSDILVGTRAVVGTEKMNEMQEEIDTLKLENEQLIAEKDVIVTQNTILEGKVNTLAAEIDLLKMQLSHKEELLAVHNYYITQLKTR